MYINILKHNLHCATITYPFHPLLPTYTLPNCEILTLAPCGSFIFVYTYYSYAYPPYNRRNDSYAYPPYNCRNGLWTDGSIYRPLYFQNQYIGAPRVSAVTSLPTKIPDRQHIKSESLYTYIFQSLQLDIVHAAEEPHHLVLVVTCCKTVLLDCAILTLHPGIHC
jgi:hypothetical protein